MGLMMVRVFFRKKSPLESASDRHQKMTTVLSRQVENQVVTFGCDCIEFPSEMLFVVCDSQDGSGCSAVLSVIMFTPLVSRGKSRQCLF